MHNAARTHHTHTHSSISPLSPTTLSWRRGGVRHERFHLHDKPLPSDKCETACQRARDMSDIHRVPPAVSSVRHLSTKPACAHYMTHCMKPSDIHRVPPAVLSVRHLSTKPHDTLHDTVRHVCPRHLSALSQTLINWRIPRFRRTLLQERVYIFSRLAGAPCAGQALVSWASFHTMRLHAVSTIASHTGLATRWSRWSPKD